MSMRAPFLPLLAVLTGALPAASAYGALAPGINARTMVFDSQTREYDISVPPSYDGSVPLPLVVDMHGFGSNKNQQRILSGFQQRSDAEGFLVAYPQGLFNSWNAGVCCGQAQAQSIDDVGFLRAMVDAIAAEANVDPLRVYATGLSNGGAMTQRLACEAADLFAAAAPMAFPIPFVPLSTCQPSRPIAVLMFMGLTDQLVSYASAAPSFQYWRDFDGCVGGSPDETVVTGDSFCETYTQCSDGVEAGLCSILSISPAPFEGHILYINNDLNLSVVAWNFLSRFQLPASVPPSTEQPVAAKKLFIKNKLPDDESRNKVVIIARDPGISTPPPLSSDDPRCNGDPFGTVKATLTVASTASGQSHTTALPCENWTILGKEANPRGYKYSDGDLLTSTARTITWKAGVQLKAVLKGNGPSNLDYDLQLGVAQGTVAATLANGTDRTCVVCPAFNGKDGSDGKRYLGRNCAAPAACP
jgi:polyhydroxybutyrate depolymerase